MTTNDFVDTFKSILDFLQGSDFRVDDYIEDLVIKALEKVTDENS